MTTQKIYCDSLEAMEKYMDSNNMQAATLYAVLEYNVELHPHNYGKHRSCVFDENEILNAIEDSTTPIFISDVENEAEAYAALEKKTSERYRRGGIWYQRGTAITANRLVWNDELEQYDTPWNAPETTVAPLEEEEDDEY